MHGILIARHQVIKMPVLLWTDTSCGVSSGHPCRARPEGRHPEAERRAQLGEASMHHALSAVQAGRGRWPVLTLGRAWGAGHGQPALPAHGGARQAARALCRRHAATTAAPLAVNSHPANTGTRATCAGQQLRPGLIRHLRGPTHCKRLRPAAARLVAAPHACPRHPRSKRAQRACSCTGGAQPRAQPARCPPPARRQPAAARAAHPVRPPHLLRS